jgi:ankyrin repeat protein
LKALLKLGADPNAALIQPGSEGWTPLHFACKFRNLKHATLLLEYGANPLAETVDGQTVLDVAKDAPHSFRKKLAATLNDALERMESNPALGHSEL